MTRLVFATCRPLRVAVRIGGRGARNIKPHHSTAFMLLRRSSDLEPFVTKDESLIQEFFHPLHEASGKVPKNLPFSIALATVKPGKRTLKHIHEASAEFYYITRGVGVIQLNSRK